MRDEEMIFYAAAAVGGYIILRKIGVFGAKPWTPERAEHAIKQAGGKVYATQTGSYWAVPGGSVRLQQEWKPNFAQRVLVGVDTIVPGDWLTRKVFGI